MKQWSFRMFFPCSLLIWIGSGASAQTNAIATSPTAKTESPFARGTPSQINVDATASPVLTLADAEALALKNQPRLLAEQLRARAADKRITEFKSGYFPQAYGNLTAVDANGDTAVAAGALTTSSVSTRGAIGGSLVQLITDFGRTSN